MPPPSKSSFSLIRHYLPYFLLIAISLGGVWLILAAGSRLHPVSPVAPTTPQVESQIPFTGVIFDNFRTPLSILLTQIIVILIFAGLFRRLFRWMAQPPVMGEMVAGIVLGPSVLGLLFPQAMAFLFPPASLDTLRLLSQIGVVIFMFLVGMELNIRHLRERGTAAVMISHASIIAPFFSAQRSQFFSTGTWLRQEPRSTHLRYLSVSQ